MVNVRPAPPVKAPAVIVTVNTWPAEMVLVPAPPAPPVTKVRVPGETTASPAPLSVIMILPSDGIVTAGVSCTVMVTLEAPLTALLRVIARPSTLLNRAGTAAPALKLSTEVFTAKPVLLLATPGPVVNSPAANVIFEVPTGKSAVAVVHTMVSVAAVNVQVAVKAAVPDTGTRVPAGVALPLK